MDRWYEGQHGVVADLDDTGPTVRLVEYAGYTTDQLLQAYIAGREPWDMKD